MNAQPPTPQTPPTPMTATISRRRVFAMVRRYWYLLRGSWPRIVELMYWPTIQMVMWGFITLHLRDNSTWVAEAAGVLLTGVLLWDILFRGQLGYTLAFLEEMYSRNLGQLFISPLRPIEMVLALMATSLLRTLIGILPAALLAIPLFAWNIFSIGLPLLSFFALLLVMGWAVGMFVTALLLRVGLGGESLAWFIAFLLIPVSAVYYPVDVLPGWLQVVAYALPPVYVFEGMRAVLFDGSFRWDYFLAATSLNILYLWLGAAAFLWSFHTARVRGLLLQGGE
ncbi:MAG: ABC transporter permease [Proteobacteria bacterium]|nr:ABC transporter permease [Pseudomonadota bacterium]